MSAAAGPSSADLAMSRYAEGDDSTFALVFSEVVPRLRGFLRRLTGSQELADDLVQETLLRMHHARGSFTPGKPVVPWAYAIARNCYVSHARSARARLDRASAGIDALDRVADAGGCGEQQRVARETALLVERALLGMTAARREAFVLLRYEGLSVSSAAQILGISEGALKIRAFHAYEIIRAALARSESPPGDLSPESAETSGTLARRGSDTQALAH